MQGHQTSQKPLTMCFAGHATLRRAPDEGHVVNHHGEGTTMRVYFCQICGKTFKGLDQLCGHVRQPQGVEEVQVHRVWLQVHAVGPPMTDAELSPTAVQAGPWSLKITWGSWWWWTLWGLRPSHGAGGGLGWGHGEALGPRWPGQRLCAMENYKSLGPASLAHPPTCRLSERQQVAPFSTTIYLVPTPSKPQGFGLEKKNFFSWMFCSLLSSHLCSKDLLKKSVPNTHLK